ncbi:hypothetical protein RHOFW510R12_01185 [Rhodanobacter sp. FW510-R12]|uniref:hypothetical protein n=1 Tax=Rhodanobacter thiooxydans TaxID=416169 RepID=UPI0009116D96|nr:hypothetical protein [Rhodanobacter thiooxydans]UJJ56647.1 hypothetical protein LRK53_18740 [Rhodanobacter thiooxydans]
MDISQLKLLAACVREHLKQSSCVIGHSQALDLIAALPGLRNWPEVMAFPSRVAGCELDIGSIARLAHRVERKFSLEIDAREWLELLSQVEGISPRGALQVWPSGPFPGVYVTTSSTAIDALLARYEEATDGGLIYAERAANGSASSIDLGEYGLWSQGIDRLPSGTLLVVGPVALDQSAWKDAAQRVEMACLHALNSDHRVAVLVDTPTPDRVCEDLDLMARSLGSDTHTALRGVITDDGQMEDRRPFSHGYSKPMLVKAPSDIDAIPRAALEPLRRELAGRSHGMVLFGSSNVTDHTGYEQLAAALALTDHAGPAARIMSRHRGTPAKDWMVPEPIKQLPFLPSIESAYAQGYRRMLVEAHYIAGDTWLEFNDVLFMGATYGHDVVEIALTLAARSGRQEREALERIVAVLGVLEVEGKKGTASAADLFIRGDATVPAGDGWEGLEEFLRSHRAIRWADELSALLDSGAVTMASAKKADPRNRYLGQFFAQRKAARRAS